jgi:uncharacterized phage-associated protein
MRKPLLSKGFQEVKKVGFDAIKLTNLILYIASHSRVKSLGVTKLWKLIYFIDAESIRNFGKSITGSEFIKYEHGPVPSRGEKILKQLRKNGQLITENKRHHEHNMTNVSALAKYETRVFSKDELEIMMSICSRYGTYTAQELSELSHLEPSWRLAKYLDKLDPHLIAYGSKEDSVGL